MAIAHGYPVPLFERLVEDADAWLHDEDALRRSVGRELSRLINARSRLTVDEFAESDGSVLDYGVPDFSERSLGSGADLDVMLATIAHAISLFETRLKNVTVAFTFPNGQGGKPVLVVNGDMNVEHSVKHVFFELETGGGSESDPTWVNLG